ncbi:MAG: DUF6456 domain-containing protein [Salaquimonas sp.]|nr:DUF6456 domain-containing protein [Salaquimonas sp.]
MSGESKNCAAQGDRQLTRLLKVIEAARGEAGLSALPNGDCRIMHRGRPVTFPAALVERCGRDGLIQCEGDRATLSPEGHAALRRRLHPDAGYVAQHGGLSVRHVELPQASQQVTINDGESPLTRLFTRKAHDGGSWLTRSQFAAGERLRADFERGRLRPRMTAVWDKPVSGGNGMAELSDFALDARRRVERALDSLDPSLAGVSLDVCCFLKGLEQVERERRWPPRSAKLMLRTALAILAGHYGFEAQADIRRRPVLHWGDATYRPSL